MNACEGITQAWRKVIAAYRWGMTYSHMRADCLYNRISFEFSLVGRRRYWSSLTVKNVAEKGQDHGRVVIVVVVKFFNKNFVKRKVENTGIQYRHTKINNSVNIVLSV